MNSKKYEYKKYISAWRISEYDLSALGSDGWVLASEAYLPKPGYNHDGQHEYVYRFIKEV